ncbi:carboxylesterase/lipase family protein [Rhodanobacter koreensis]
MITKRRLILLASGWLALHLGGALAQSVTEVVVDSGRLHGVASGDVVSFKGIPYAAPPVGSLRWRPPQPAAHWQGVREATDFGHDCMQALQPGDAAVLKSQPAEDCLFLNVWRPGKAAHKLPVMVWLHGGAFVNGGSSPPIYSGESFARNGVVFVSLNYRLGRFGFFGFPALTREHPDESKGNYGYMDQIAALKWVKRNIAAFGGDPRNVTVFGESAGGMSVHMLLTSPQAKGLFEKAIIESGAGRGGPFGPRRLSEDVPGYPSAEHVGVNFAHQHGVEGDDAAALAKLRDLPADQIASGLNMTSLAVMWLTGQTPTVSGPMLDGRIVVETPDEAYLAKRQARVPVMIGANNSDMGLSIAHSMQEALAPFGTHAAKAGAAYNPEGSADYALVNARVGADKYMVEPARMTARAMSEQGIPAYEYRFSYVATGMRKEWIHGAPHASEIPYVFRTLEQRYDGLASAEDKQVARVMQAYWVNFARTGDPNGTGLPHWPRYSTKDELLEFTADGHATAKPDPWRKRLDLTEQSLHTQADPAH